jgi:L-aspartate oxidase
LTGLFIVAGALARTESRGGHCRTDFPDRAAVAERRLLHLRDVAPELVLPGAVEAAA